MGWSRFVEGGAVVVAAMFVVIQAVPYGRDHANPPVTGQPQWNAPRTRQLAARACFDCHSNQTRWPWYSLIAPASWLVQRDVDRARRFLDFSQWDRPQRHADDAADMVESGEMPPPRYLLVHPEARLSKTERAELVRGLRDTFESRAKGTGR